MVRTLARAPGRPRRDIRATSADPRWVVRTTPGRRAPAYSVARAARDAVELLGLGEPLSVVWRHAVIQLLDVYESRRRHAGLEGAARLFDEPPELTGDARVDAAFAALAEHLARRDDWPVPDWARDPSRATDDWWFVTELPGMYPWSLRESPLSFRRRGVFIAANGLERV